MAPAFTRFITLDGHRRSRLYRGANPTADITLAQILPRAREAGLSHRAKREFRSRN